MFDLGIGQQVARGGHDDGDAGLVIGAQKGCAGGGDDVVALLGGEIGRLGGRERELWRIGEGDIAAVVAFVNHGFDACRVELWCRIDMGQKAQRGRVIARCAWERGEDGSVVCLRDICRADLFKLGHEQALHIELDSGAGACGAVGIGLAVDLAIADQAVGEFFGKTGVHVGAL